MKHEFPTNEDVILELAKNMIKDLTSNPDCTIPAIPIAELQRLVDEVVMARYAEAVARRIEEQVNEEVQAARERLRLVEQSLQGHDGTHDDTSLLASSRVGLADHIFFQLSDRSNTLRILKTYNE